MSITALGVVRMDEARLSWRALRPVFLAGAAALSWLAITGSAASADVLPDAAPAAGIGAGSGSIPVLPQSISGFESAAPALGEVLPPSPIMAASDIISTVPVVEPLVPHQTLQVVPPPVTGLAGETTSVVLEILPEALEAAPVLEPVLQPVTDVAAESLPLPAAHLASIQEASEERPTEAATTPPESAGTAPDPATTAAARFVSAEAALDTDPGAAEGAPSDLFRSDGFSDSAWEAVNSSVEEQPQPAHPGPLPAHSPNVPNSGATGGATSAGSSAGVGWLSPFGINFLPPGDVRASGPSQHVPAPVSFDPGSSPD